MARWECKKEALTFTAMAAIALNSVVLNTLYKAASLKGLSNFVFITYSHAIGALVLLPFLFIFPITGLPPLSMSIIRRFVLISIIGYSSNLCAYKGVEYSSPTLASVVSNLVPAFTFLWAIAFRMETVDFRSSRTQAKTIGTVVSVSGALVAILYRGPIILSSMSLTTSLSLEHSLLAPQTNWITGGLLLLIFCLLASFWYILQFIYGYTTLAIINLWFFLVVETETQIVKLYPSPLIVAIVDSLGITILGAILGPILEPNTSAWRLTTDMSLITVLLYGVFGPSLTTVVHTWGLGLKGPVYVTIFQPLSVAVAAALGVTFLGDALCLGSVIGAATILLGFYAVIWGKSKEETSQDCLSAIKTPLLRSCGDDNTFV